MKTNHLGNRREVGRKELQRGGSVEQSVREVARCGVGAGRWIEPWLFVLAEHEEKKKTYGWV